MARGDTVIDAKVDPLAEVATRYRALFPKWRGHLPVRQRLAPAFSRLIADHRGLAATIEATPYPAFEAAHGELPPVHGYRTVPASARAMLASMPERMRAPWLCGLLIDRMTAFDEALVKSGLHSEFDLHYRDSFHRILDQIDRDPGFAAIDRDAFLKDLWLTRCVMIPAYASILWPRSGLSMRAILRGGLPTLYRAIRHCGGRQPMLEGHTHGHDGPRLLE